MRSTQKLLPRRSVRVLRSLADRRALHEFAAKLRDENICEVACTSCARVFPFVQSEKCKDIDWVGTCRSKEQESEWRCSRRHKSSWSVDSRARAQ